MKKDAGEVVLLGDANGVSVVKRASEFAVSFAHDRELAAMLSTVHGAVFDQVTRAFVVPSASESKLTDVVGEMRKEVDLVANDLLEITELATNAALVMQHKAGEGDDVVPQISSFIEPGRVYRGSIVNANTRFVAQKTGSGKQDGAVFIQIHRLANLPGSALFKGDSVSVTYDEKFLGDVAPFVISKPMADLEHDFKSQDGQEFDGVIATDRGETIGVSYEFNPRMNARIRRVDGAQFKKEEKLWEIPKSVKSYALYAIADLRVMFNLDRKDITKLTDVAHEHIDNPKIFSADVRAGATHFGVIVDIGEYLVLQSSGRGTYNLHHLSLLTDVPVKGHDTKIQYNDGFGQVTDMHHQRLHEFGR